MACISSEESMGTWAKITRSSLLIVQGKVSAALDGLIDDAEPVRAAPLLDVHLERPRTPLYSAEMDIETTSRAECCQTLVEGQESYPEDR